MAKTTPSSRRRRSRDAAAQSPAEITNYSAAIRYLRDRVDLERMRVVRFDNDAFKLDRMRALMQALGDPQNEVPLVHIGGTVGKGSTVAMVASMLTGCGYAVGKYTSPHLVDVRERIDINGQPIGKPDFAELMREVAEAAASIDLEPTFFEAMTAMAFKHFADQAVDIAVVEVGLGGRLDSTNVITPEVTVITRIDYDHTHLLGRTLEKIATEKAGLIKRGIPVVTCEQERAVDTLLREKAEEMGAPITVLNKEIDFSCRFSASGELGPSSHVCVATPHNHFMHLPVPLPGEHQAINCGLALAVIDALKQGGMNCDEVSMLEGLGRTKLPGRMEMLWERPRILVDGAHNPASLSALMRCVGAHAPYDSMVCIFGCCDDKDIPNMLKATALGADKLIFTRAKGQPRAVDPDELQRAFTEVSGKMCQVSRSLPEALEVAARAVGRDDLVCVTGSFYLVGEAKKHLTELERKRQPQ